jgi:hypothetical protein
MFLQQFQMNGDGRRLECDLRLNGSATLSKPIESGRLINTKPVNQTR